jgi:hypothetical protein
MHCVVLQFDESGVPSALNEKCYRSTDVEKNMKYLRRKTGVFRANFQKKTRTLRVFFLLEGADYAACSVSDTTALL